MDYKTGVMFCLFACGMGTVAELQVDCRSDLASGASPEVGNILVAARINLCSRTRGSGLKVQEVQVGY